MQADPSQLLAQLQDIHRAAEPAWWPPAPGWWVLALLAAVLLAMVLRRAKRRMAVHRRRKAWLQALDALVGRHDPIAAPHDYLAAMNRLFRAVAVKAFPETSCRRLQGEEWVAFITSQMPDDLDTACLAALASGPYEAVPAFDADALRTSARTWVKQYG